MLIGVDMDDVIFPYNRGFLLFHNANFGTNLKREQFRHYSYRKVLDNVGINVSEEEVARRIMAYESSVFFSDRSIVPGSKSRLRNLAKKNELVIITSRREELLDISHEWVDMHFDDIFGDIYFASRDPRVGAKSKFDLCLELGIDVMLEDQLEIALACQYAVEKCVYLFDTPWNRPWERIGGPKKVGKLPSAITRVKGWSDIGKYLKC